MRRVDDAIAAIATPMGEGAISIIRVSGELAIQKVSGRFKGKKKLTTVKSHTAHFGRIVDGEGSIVDDVVCTVYHAPTSFTGEDTVEVNCHGGIHVTRRVLECLLETGIRPAEPGEFTQRAFLNGKMDLSQAEAVADLIQARSDKAYKISLYQLEGALSKELNALRDKLVKSLGLLELELDFVDEGIELIDKKTVEDSIKSDIQEVDTLLSTYKYGKIWREGIRVALVGAPNAGKSSLLNALLNEERAIVTEIPGTTRDFIEGKMSISGILFRIIDTAGLRKAEDLIEREGVRRTWKVVQTADIVVLVHDCTKTLINSEIDFIETICQKRHQKGLIIANNKIDLQDKMQLAGHLVKGHSIVETSALNNKGVADLKNELARHIVDKPQAEGIESIVITNERHYSALLRVKEALSLSLESVQKRESNEFIAVNLRLAIDSIGEIIGSVTTEDILNSIFSKFCIGK